MTASPEVKEGFADVLKDVPAPLRPKIAAAHNAQVRAEKARAEWYDRSREFRSMVRSLHYRNGVSMALLGRVLELSRTRIAQIVGKKK